MEVHPRARGDTEPGSDLDVILAEDPGRDVGIGEPGNVVGTVAVALVCKPGNPCVLRGCSTQGDFPEKQIVAVLLHILTELMAVVLVGGGKASGEDVATAKEPLDVPA